MIKLMAKIRFDTPEGTHEETLYHNIVSVDVEALDRGNVTDVINWGVYSNRGSLSFIDRDGTINGMLEKHRVIDVQVFIADNSDEILLATMDASDFFYNVDTGQIDLELLDKLDSLQNKPFSRLYPFETSSIYNLAQSVFINQAGMSLDDWVEAKNSSALELMVAVNVYCPDIQARNVWDAITQLCETAMLRVYADRYGKPYIAGIPKAKARPIIIRSRNILSQPRITPRGKTSLNLAELSLTDRGKYRNARVSDGRVLKFYDDFIPSERDDNGKPLAHPDADFIGDDTTQNPDVTISQSTLEDDWGVTRSTVYVSDLNVPLKPNTHTVTDVVTTGTFLTQANDETYFLERNQSINHQKMLLDYDINSAELTMSFEILDARIAPQFVSEAITNCAVRVLGDYYEDAFKDDDSSSLGLTVIPTNSLMQTKNTANGNDYGEWYTNEIITRYGDGVVCCELECGFSDYYYEDGTPAKLTSQNINDIFGKYNVVQPYVTRGGVEVPLATYQDGSPMSFVIIGIKYHYAGIAKQTLYLQEYREV